MYWDRPVAIHSIGPYDRIPFFVSLHCTLPGEFLLSLSPSACQAEVYSWGNQTHRWAPLFCHTVTDVGRMSIQISFHQRPPHNEPDVGFGRGDYGIDLGRNLIHGSDSVEVMLRLTRIDQWSTVCTIQEDHPSTDCKLLVNHFESFSVSCMLHLLLSLQSLWFSTCYIQCLQTRMIMKPGSLLLWAHVLQPSWPTRQYPVNFMDDDLGRLLIAVFHICIQAFGPGAYL